MKYKSVSCLIFFLVTLTFIHGCKKDDPQDNPVSNDYYSGTYSFTSTSTSYPDSVVHYDGSISYDKASKVLTINYWEPIYTPAFPYTIVPVVDEKGVLSYPAWTNAATGLFFNGNIDFAGNISFKIGNILTHWGQTYETSRTVTGKRITL